MKTNYPLLICLLSFNFSYLISFAQFVKVDKEEANNIKKNEEILYGEAVGGTIEEAYDAAFQDLMATINDYRVDNPNMISADGVLIQNIKSKAKKIVYMKNVKTQAVCVYVNIKDISPLYATSDASFKGNNTIIILNEEDKQVKEKEDSPPITSTEKPSDIIPETNKAKSSTQKSITIEQEKKKEIETNTSQDSVGLETPLPPEGKAIESTMADSQVTKFNLGTSKEEDIVFHLKTCNNYAQVKDYLTDRKAKLHDIVYKPQKGYDAQQDCYWLVFDNAQNLIALIDKGNTHNILNGQADKIQNHLNQPKLWLIIYE